MPHALVWFRNDLRLADNPALQAAVRAGFVPVPVYIHAPDEEGDWSPGAASDAWRQRSLQALAADLQARGSRLQVFRGDSLATLQRLATQVGAEAVFWNRRYEPAIEARDAGIKRTLRQQGLRAESHNGALLFEPWQVQGKTGDPYRVFTPFWRTAQAQWRLPAASEPPERLPAPPALEGAVDIAALALAPTLRWDAGFWDEWTPGEAGAVAAASAFAMQALDGYGDGRDRPDRRGTSRLSPHLHFGEIAPWRIVRLLEGVAVGEDREAYVRELGWREFAHHVLHHFPHTPEANFNPRFDGFAWAQPTPQQLQAWQHGRTGIPIVDAGMRELWHTGWMHNRVRMIVASLLCKNLRVHWREGARWFWDTLVDADLASNSLGWQWVAGTGADAAPYYRVFNPVLQAQRFDPAGDYIARWVPELASLAPAQRHAPWTGTIPRGYVPPMVDLAKSRQAALDALARNGR
ncbi:cryptochrome/photolyase family protein [Lysobacter solisilvae (ex Woo and Kim 2020)]|uniref:Deoxyribodipyrimidine photo-lyase n=1 Tax=Agrilutibacter terrestris TaxID=2865112 RepID=A0A7H0G0D5_9GAMM|nr:deoxyribodipyrimidine photo-lyase [Lysobacter terrestris]QNP41751.1 deoxyribodipyrimidine photo-lyase [Lysobacter terrestris]